MIEVQVCDSRDEWDNLVLNRGGHPLQLWGWGEVKAAHNWQAVRLVAKEDGRVVGYSQVLLRTLPKPLNKLMFAYSPRPRIGRGGRADAIERIIKYTQSKYPVIYFTMDPDQETIKLSRKWRKTNNTILIPKTLILDLEKSEDDLMQAMTKKTRQYIRKSAKEDIEIRRIYDREELEQCMEIYKQTATRAGFALHTDDYYYDVDTFLGDKSQVFGAFSREKIVAFLWLAVSDETAFELYGGMNDEGQKLRANYSLKWQAIRQMKQAGVVRYDMNGLLNDGVSTFKRGFADHENILVGTYDYPLSPLYVVWVRLLPLARSIMRTIKNRRLKNNN